jgi:carbonic anhydrase
MPQLPRILAAAALAIATTATAALASAPATHDPEHVLSDLAAGNRQFATQSYTHAPVLTRQRAGLTTSQAPKAVVVGCSDSRVPPELVFNQGLGSLFVIRTAGGALDDAAIGSIEYAVEHLGVPLVIVLGHEQCGAVKAAMQENRETGKLQRLVDRLHPALVHVPYTPGDPVDNAVRANVVHVMAHLQATEPVLAPASRSGRIKVLGGVYSLSTGRIEFLNADGQAISPLNQTPSPRKALGH